MFVSVEVVDGGGVNGHVTVGTRQGRHSPAGVPLPVDRLGAAGRNAVIGKAAPVLQEQLLSSTSCLDSFVYQQLHWFTIKRTSMYKSGFCCRARDVSDYSAAVTFALVRKALDEQQPSRWERSLIQGRRLITASK